MRRFKCLTCRSIVSDKYIHSHGTNPPHKKFIEIGTDGEEKLSITQRWAAELENDEMEGMHTMKIKIATFELIKQISTTIEAATFDLVITKAIEALLREEKSKELTFEYEETETEE